MDYYSRYPEMDMVPTTSFKAIRGQVYRVRRDHGKSDEIWSTRGRK